jgi:predicted DNA-binding protein (MmcQ/YjbR family)
VTSAEKIMDYSSSIYSLEYHNTNLEKLSEKIYKSNYGYFINKDKWIFIPLEKEFDANDLMIIADTLRNLNENEV